MPPSEPCAEAKTGEFKVTIFVNQDVIWLDITMDEFHIMDAFNSTGQLSHIKPTKKPFKKMFIGSMK